MDRDAVLARLMLLTEDDRTALLETLAGDAARMVEARLRCTEAEAAANAEALTAAAAAYAAYQLALVDASCAPDSLTAGDVRAETMLHFLAAREIYLSSGSACSRAQPSHVLTAMGLPANEVQSALRVSFSRETTEEDVRRFLEALGEGLQTLARRPARGAGMRRRSI